MRLCKPLTEILNFEPGLSKNTRKKAL